MANIEFRNPSKQDLNNQPAYVSDLALAMGVDFSEKVQNEDGKEVYSAVFWTNDLNKDGENISGGYISGTKGLSGAEMYRNDIGVLPCIKNAAENGITTARLSNNPNDAREYLYDEKTQSFKMAPQTVVSGSIGNELTELLNGQFGQRITELTDKYNRGLINSKIYEETLTELQEKQKSFSVLESGFPTVQRFGGEVDGKDGLKPLKTVSYNGETYACYENDSFRDFNNRVKEGAEFSNGVTVYDRNKTTPYSFNWFKYEPILAERKENGDVQLRTVLMPCPRISKHMLPELNAAVETAQKQEGGLRPMDLKFRPIEYRYLNGNFAAHLGLTTDLTLEHGQKLQQAHVKETEQSM